MTVTGEPSDSSSASAGEPARSVTGLPDLDLTGLFVLLRRDLALEENPPSSWRADVDRAADLLGAHLRRNKLPQRILFFRGVAYGLWLAWRPVPGSDDNTSDPAADPAADPASGKPSGKPAGEPAAEPDIAPDHHAVYANSVWMGATALLSKRLEERAATPPPPSPEGT